MSNLRAQMIRLAYTNSALRPHLLPFIKQGSDFTLYEEYLAWKDELSVAGKYFHPGMNLGMNRHKAEKSSQKTFQMLSDLWYKDVNTEAKLHAWASRIRDPNVAMSLAFTGHQLADGDFVRFDSEYFFQNWKTNASQFKAFGRLVEKVCGARFWEIAGRSSRVKPEAPPKNQFTPPPIPPNLIPTDVNGWALYDTPGAEKAARALASAMKAILISAGRDILPTNTDEANAKKVYAFRERMGKVFSTYSNWGASDGEPESVFRTVLRRYLELYLDKWVFSKTYSALNRFG